MVVMATPFIGPVTVHGPWRDRGAAQAWARENVRGTWSIVTLETPDVSSADVQADRSAA
jgi:hypothetical protein